MPSTAPKQTQAVCYRYAKPGHIRPECPLHWGKPHTTVVCIDEVKEGSPVEDYPEEEGQEEDPPVIQVKQGNDLLNRDQHLDNLVESSGAQGIPYEWDDELDVIAHKEAPSVKMGQFASPIGDAAGGESDAVTHHKNFNSNGCA